MNAAVATGLVARVLPCEEWHRLARTELASVARDAPGAEVVVVERDGAIVGCWALLLAWHVEGLWIAPADRGHASVARRLWRAMRALVATREASHVFTVADSKAVLALLDRVGAKRVPGDSYVFSFEEGLCQQQHSPSSA